MFDVDGSGTIDTEEVISLLTGDDFDNLISKEAIR
jgi:Ca2+-binding EF-hand superfamily protein